MCYLILKTKVYFFKTRRFVAKIWEPTISREMDHFNFLRNHIMTNRYIVMWNKLAEILKFSNKNCNCRIAIHPIKYDFLRDIFIMLTLQYFDTSSILQGNATIISYFGTKVSNINLQSNPSTQVDAFNTF